MSHAHQRNSLRQHLAALHGKSPSHGHDDSKSPDHSDGSGRGDIHHADAAGVPSGHHAHRRTRAGRLLLLVCVVQLMVILDITAVNVALPQLADGLHINGSDIGWTITSYSLIFGSLLLLGGRAAGLIGWQAIFLINVPVGLALAVTATKIVPADAARPQWRGLDGRGAVLATGSLGAIVFALSQATSAGWTSLQTLGIGGARHLRSGRFALIETHTAQPLLQIRRLADRAVGGGFAMMLAARRWPRTPRHVNWPSRLGSCRPSQSRRSLRAWCKRGSV